MTLDELSGVESSTADSEDSVLTTWGNSELFSYFLLSARLESREPLKAQ